MGCRRRFRKDPPARQPAPVDLPGGVSIPYSPPGSRDVFSVPVPDGAVADAGRVMEWFAKHLPGPDRNGRRVDGGNLGSAQWRHSSRSVRTGSIRAARSPGGKRRQPLRHSTSGRRRAARFIVSGHGRVNERAALVKDLRQIPAPLSVRSRFRPDLPPEASPAGVTHHAGSDPLTEPTAREAKGVR